MHHLASLHPGEYAGTEGLVLLVCALLAGLLAKGLLHRSKVPFTVLLTLFGALMGVLHRWRRGSDHYDETALAGSTTAYMEMNPHSKADSPSSPCNCYESNCARALSLSLSLTRRSLRSLPK